MGVGAKKPVWVYSTEPAALAAASPPIVHEKGQGLPLHLPALPPPAFPLETFLPGITWKCLVSAQGDGLEGAAAVLQRKAQAGVTEGGATALSGMSSYPLQDGKSHDDCGHQPPRLFNLLPMLSTTT